MKKILILTDILDHIKPLIGLFKKENIEIETIIINSENQDRFYVTGSNKKQIPIKISSFDGDGVVSICKGFDTFGLFCAMQKQFPHLVTRFEQLHEDTMEPKILSSSFCKIHDFIIAGFFEKDSNASNHERFERLKNSKLQKPC